jgi:hypothetical protein
VPQYDAWIGQDLYLTIESRENETAAELAGRSGPEAEPAGHELRSLRELFAALRHCWLPPPREAARQGMQMSVRFAFKRSGEIIAEPRVTYATPNTPQEVRVVYRKAITAALDRCTPMAFSAGLGGAVAGRPIAIRFVDNRTAKGSNEQP